MKRKSLLFLTPLLVLSASAGFINGKSTIAVKADEIDFSSDKWTDYGNNLWSIDSELSTLSFCTEEILGDERPDKIFTGNLLLTDQFNTRDASVSLEATFKGSVSSQDIIDNKEEVHFGLVPWYKDSDNWIICYAKFSTCDDVEIKNGHLFDFQFYAKIDGSTHVEYYVKDDGNRWVANDDKDNSEWHSAWPDRTNTNKNPATLQDLELDPSSEVSIYVKKTRKTYAGKDCDSMYVKVNNYEMNFGLDNFMFSDMKAIEDAEESFVPKVGFYLFGTKKATVRNISITTSHDEVLPLPTIEPLTNPTTSGTINKKVTLPEFMACDNNGLKIDYNIKISDPDDEEVALDGEDYFIPLKEGTYKVSASATDENGYTGTYDYNIKVKSGTNHIDYDVYDDIYTYIPKDTAITAAYVIFISVPVVIVLYIGLKIFFYVRKKRKQN